MRKILAALCAAVLLAGGLGCGSKTVDVEFTEEEVQAMRQGGGMLGAQGAQPQKNEEE